MNVDVDTKEDELDDNKTEVPEFFSDMEGDLQIDGPESEDSDFSDMEDVEFKK